jgi:hypothetical protein
VFPVGPSLMGKLKAVTDPPDALVSQNGAGDGAELRQLARNFIYAAFPELARVRVIPTSDYRRLLQVGRDYMGGDLMFLDAFQELEARLQQAYPARFSRPLGHLDADFPNSYIFSLLEGVIARTYPGDQHPDEDSIDKSIDEFIGVLEATERDFYYCRAVSHLTTKDEGVVTIEGVSIYPDAAYAGGILGVTQKLIPAVSAAYNGEPPSSYDPPHALLVAHGAFGGGNQFGLEGQLSRAVDRFLLLTRLLHMGTNQSLWQVSGGSSLVSGIHPRYMQFLGTTVPNILMQRIISLSDGDGAAFTALGQMIDAAAVARKDKAATSFDVALYEFSHSYEPGAAHEHIVDLATALEAIVTGNERETEAISLRLKSRAAALLACERDPAQTVFRDIGKLYGLRSQLVHGSSIDAADLKKLLTGISTVPTTAPSGVVWSFAVDRLRDLVRRLFLARLCLAEGSSAIWPFTGSTPVDALLSDATERDRWRQTWRDRLTALGAAEAANPAVAANDPLAPRV